MLCEFCGSEFIACGSFHRFCSPKCQNKQWQKDNPELQRKIWRDAYWKNREEKLAYVKEYFKDNPEVNKKATKKYSLTLKGKLVNRKKVKAYRARRLGATGSHTHEEFLGLILRFDNYCPACGSKFATVDFTEDHIVPLSCGGSDNISNIQPLCHSCNSRKRNRTKDYRAEEYGYHLSNETICVHECKRGCQAIVLPSGSSVKSGNVTDGKKGV